VGGNAALDGDLAALASTDEEDDEEGADGVKRPKVNGNSDRPKTKAQVDRRRERNRILARRTRLRKKFFFESLQKQVRCTSFCVCINRGREGGVTSSRSQRALVSVRKRAEAWAKKCLRIIFSVDLAF